MVLHLPQQLGIKRRIVLQRRGVLFHFGETYRHGFPVTPAHDIHERSPGHSEDPCA